MFKALYVLTLIGVFTVLGGITGVVGAFLLAGSQGDIFMAVGKKTDIRFIGFEQAADVEAVDEDTDGDEDDMDFGEKLRDAHPSMSQDHQARKRCEIDAINGAIPREAEAFRLSVPTNTFVTQVIKARESVF